MLFAFPTNRLWNKHLWVDSALSVLPNLLGFSLGAIAIILAFPSSQFFRVFREGGRDDSYYITTASRFVHFVILQVVAIMLSLLSKSHDHSKILSFIGYIAFVYAVSSAVFGALSLFGIAEIHNHPNFDKISTQPKDEDIKSI